MKPRLGTSILLFLSAYAPLFLLLVVKDFDFEAFCFNHLVITIVITSISSLALILLFVSMWIAPYGNLTAEVTTVTPRSLDIMNYSIPYFFSVFDVDIGSKADIIALLLLLGLMLILTVKSKVVFVNPLIGIAGFQYYDIVYKQDGHEYPALCISKYEINRGSTYRLTPITKFIHFARENGNTRN